MMPSFTIESLNVSASAAMCANSVLTWPTVPLMSMTRSLVPGKYSFARDNWMRAELCVWNSVPGAGPRARH